MASLMRWRIGRSLKRLVALRCIDMPKDAGKIANFPPYKRARVADLVPYARNSRTHSDAQIAQIAASIREFGFTNPVLTDGDNGIIAGHGRVLAAQDLGMKDVPVIELSHLTDDQRKAYVLADNKLALNAGWDYDLLRTELAELDGAGFDLTLIGFSETELSSIACDVEEQESGSELSSGMEYRIIVDCRDENQQTELLDRFDQEGLTCRPLIS